MNRLRSGLLAVAVAASTTVAVTITAQPASADVLTPQEIKVVQGVVKAAGPRVAARAVAGGAVCAGTLGVGCAVLTVVGVAGLAYDTRDIWMPWVKNQLGQGELVASGNLASKYNVTFLTVPLETEYATTATRPSFNVQKYAGVSGSARYRVTMECRQKISGVWGSWQTVTYESNTTGGLTWSTNYTMRGCATVDTNPAYPWMVRGVTVGLLEGTATGTFTPMLLWSGSKTVTSVDTELVCQRPEGSTYSVLYSTPNPTTQVGAGHCLVGDTPIRIKGSASLDGGTAIPQWDIPLGNDTTHDQEYPLCAAAACGYRIRVDGNPCVEGVEKCTHWSYIWSQQAYRVECFYGPYSIAVGECLFLERAYDLATGAKTITTPNTDGDPATWTDPAPAPSRTTTITPSPTSTSTSTASPTTAPTPVEVGTPQPSPPPDPAGARCFPQGWASFNPFQWVYMPVMCALRDAFVPDKTLTTTRLESVRTKLETKGPGPAIAEVTSTIASVPSEGGCQGPGMTITLAGQTQTLHLFNACTTPMSTVAGYAKALFTVVLVVGGSLSVVRALAGAFGLNFSMGRGARDGD